MNNIRRLKKAVRRLQREKAALLRELFALQMSCNAVVARHTPAIPRHGQPTPTSESEMAALRQRHHAFMAEYRTQQPKEAA